MINTILKTNKKRLSFHIMRELFEIEELDSSLPGNNEVRKYVSSGGFSSIGFVKFIADRTFIKELTVSTLRVGKKHLAVLGELKKQGKLDKVNFIVGSIMQDGSKKDKEYHYFDILQETCSQNNWVLKVRNNHSKILLFDTDKGKFVIETSSNLNENPKMEQFSFEKDEVLYFFYQKVFDELFADEN
ncbi:MAG: hypothetical protein WCR54_08555 [Clostridia bacterium]